MYLLFEVKKNAEKSVFFLRTPLLAINCNFFILKEILLSIHVILNVLTVNLPKHFIFISFLFIHIVYDLLDTTPELLWQDGAGNYVNGLQNALIIRKLNVREPT